MNAFINNTAQQQNVHANFFVAAQRRYPTYDYSNTVLVSMHRPVEVVCPEHGVFTTMPRQHIGTARTGCPTCAKPARAPKITEVVTEQQVIQTKNKLRIYMQECAKLVLQLAEEEKSLGRAPTTGVPTAPAPQDKLAKFIELSNKIYGANHYTYKKTHFDEGSRTVIVTCRHHGDFLTTPRAHTQRILLHSCPHCRELGTPI